MNEADIRHEKLSGKDFYERNGKKEYKGWRHWQPPKIINLEEVTKSIFGIDRDKERGTKDGTTDRKVKEE